eukprot:gene18174-21142_t
MSQGKVSSKSYVPVGSAVEMIPSAPPLVGDEPVVNVLHAVPYDPPLRGVSNEIEDHPESDDEDEEGFTEYGVTPKWREDRPIKIIHIQTTVVTDITDVTAMGAMGMDVMAMPVTDATTVMDHITV